MLDCLVNGAIDHRVAADDRGFTYGDGVFETIGVHHGAPRWWQTHIDRLRAGCERLDLPQPDQSVLLREVQTVSAGHAHCVVKIILTRGGNTRGYSPHTASGLTRVVSAHRWPPALPDARRGLRVRICDLRLAIQPSLGGIKHLNRLEQVLARAEWDDPDIAEGLLLDPEDHLVCATAANLFVVKDDRLLTPRLDRCGVRGVLRAEILKGFHARCEQRRLRVDVLADADELFLASALRGVMPVVRVDDRTFSVGPVTRDVMAWHEAAVRDE